MDNTFDVSLVQGNTPCGYATFTQQSVDYITECCGCRPSKWDGVKATDLKHYIYQCLQEWNYRVLDNILEHNEKRSKSDSPIHPAAIMVLEHLYTLCNEYPEARVEVRF